MTKLNGITTTYKKILSVKIKQKPFEEFSRSYTANINFGKWLILLRAQDIEYDKFDNRIVVNWK